MIHGKAKQRIVSYLAIDHAGEGFMSISPEPGEMFIGYPYGLVEVGSVPFIEVRKGGKPIRTVNALDCAMIEFA